jgi:predicted enzyme related to lactoylglutathione lyase
MDSVRAFDIPVDDMERAKKFYQSIFGWKIIPVPGSGGDFHAAITAPVDENGELTIPGAINGGFYKRGTHDLEGTFLEIEVDSIDECLERIISEGGEIVRPKNPILDTAFFSVVRDSEGNVMGLWENIEK